MSEPAKQPAWVTDALENGCACRFEADGATLRGSMCEAHKGLLADYVEKIRTALQPFADAALESRDAWRKADASMIEWGVPNDADAMVTFTQGQLNAAEAALAKNPSPAGVRCPPGGSTPESGTETASPTPGPVGLGPGTHFGWRCHNCNSSGVGIPAMRDGRNVCPICLAAVEHPTPLGVSDT